MHVATYKLFVTVNHAHIRACQDYKDSELTIASEYTDLIIS